MGRLSASILALALGLAAAMALVSCGGSSSADLLPGSTASQINSNLDQVEQLAGEGECVGAENAAAEVSTQVESLTGVDAKLKQALSEGAARLNEVLAACEEATPEEPTETTETVEEPETDQHKEKPEKPEKPKKEGEPAEESEEETEEPLPPSKGKGNEESGGPPSGGVGPGAPTGGD
jgi:outer membrane biosynthesis protein TonB